MIVARWFVRKRYFRFSRHIAGAIRRRLIRAIALFVILFVIHVLVMMAAEGFGLGEAVWLTITTATTVGYGDISASSAVGRTATILCMYVFGIFLLAQIATDVFDYRALQRDRRRRGQLEWKNMKDHLLVINVPAEYPEAYLARLVADVRNTPQLADIPVQILTTSFPDGLPTQLVNAGVTHYTGVAENTENLRAANVAEARHIVIIAGESNDPRADALTYDILSRIGEIRSNATVVAEAVDDGNRQRLLDAGANTVVRPVRAYPEIVVRAMIEPGTEQDPREPVHPRSRPPGPVRRPVLQPALARRGFVLRGGRRGIANGLRRRGGRAYESRTDVDLQRRRHHHAHQGRVGSHPGAGRGLPAELRRLNRPSMEQIGLSVVAVGMGPSTGDHQ